MYMNFFSNWCWTGKIMHTIHWHLILVGVSTSGFHSKACRRPQRGQKVYESCALFWFIPIDIHEIILWNWFWVTLYGSWSDLVIIYWLTRKPLLMTDQDSTGLSACHWVCLTDTCSAFKMHWAYGLSLTVLKKLHLVLSSKHMFLQVVSITIQFML